MKAVVVLPVYNQRESLARLVPEILRADPRLHVLVVDDDSPDGTGDWVAGMAAADPRVRLVRRLGRLGYGTACLRGFRAALAAGADLVLCMEADGSHAAADLPRFLTAGEQAGIIVGSRYLGGAERGLMSRGGNRYLRWATRLPLTDFTSRFRGYHRPVLQAIDLDTVVSDGPAFLVELACRATRRGFRVTEVPLRSDGPVASHSCLSAAALLETVLVPWRVRGAPQWGPPISWRTDSRLST